MKRQIRNGVYETNSSSVHSLCYSKDGLEPSNLKINEDNEIEIDFGHFGREYNFYDSQYDKLSYLITCLYYMSKYDINLIYDSYEFRLIEEEICDYTGASGIKILCKKEPYIDHQSIPYDGIEIINIYDREALINFVFNKNITLKTSGD